MVVVRRAGSRWPSLYDSWRDWRGERAVRPPPGSSAGRHDFCGYCWAQGRLLEPAANGEGLVPRTCPRCGGTGLLPTA